MHLLAAIFAEPMLAQSGGNTVDVVKIVIFLLILAGSGIAWAFRTLKEQHAQKKILDERRRREAEAIRTGRAPEPFATESQINTAPMQSPMQPGSQDVKRRLQELAQRRRAELEALRRQAQAGGGMDGGMATAGSPMPPRQQPPVRPAPSIGPASSGEDIAERRRRQIAAQRQEQERAQAKASAQAETLRRQREQRALAERQRQQQQQQASAKSSTSSSQSRRENIRENPAAAGRPAAAATSGAGLPSIGMGSPAIGAMPSAATPEGAAAWRRYIIATEVLGKPVAMRGDEDGRGF